MVHKEVMANNNIDDFIRVVCFNLQCEFAQEENNLPSLRLGQFLDRPQDQLIS